LQSFFEKTLVHPAELWLADVSRLLSLSGTGSLRSDYSAGTTLAATDLLLASASICRIFSCRKIAVAHFPFTLADDFDFAL
jgi:hypothetical protein